MLRTTSTLARRLIRKCSQKAALSSQNDLLRRELDQVRRELAETRAAMAISSNAGASAASHAGAEAEGADRSCFVGAKGAYTSELKFWDSTDVVPPVLPVFRLMDDLGKLVPGAEAAVPVLSREEALAMMHTMVRVQEFDKVFLESQRQGRISFYLTSRGEEAASVGSAAALHPTDWMLPQYREMGAMFWRGFSFDDVANQLVGNSNDSAHGRQLGMHLGSKDKHVVTISSPLGTQCPQAAGVSWHLKRMARRQVAIAYFGEGSASEGDVPSALNIAAVHGCPTIFFCRNNGYAISTRSDEQYVGDGVAPRGLAFGMPTIRVDGNDILAVAAATHRARQIGLIEGRPTMVEAMTYRSGAHSTSDDDSKYREPMSPVPGWDSERAFWESRSPLVRFGRYLHSLGWFNGQMEYTMRSEARRCAIRALNAAHSVGGPKVASLFTDVYDELPPYLTEQHEALKTQISSYREHYDYLSEKQLEGM
jgi:2-oxoisovalerate dehydrogenase E1 component alpha subunit